MKKIDLISWILSIIINLSILFILAYKPFLNVDEAQAIKVGLVSLDTNETTSLKGESNQDAFDKNLESKKVEEKKESEQTKEETEKQDKKEAEEIEKSIETNAEKVVSETKEEKKQKPSLKDLKKSIAESKPNSKDLIKQDKSFSPSEGKSEYIDRKISVSGDSNGLISGDISGSSNGDEIFILWAKTNKNPSFPDRAKIQGKTGNMMIRIEVDQAGTILSYSIEKGSGVPEIDLAVEKVIGGWNLKIKKNNKIVAGVFKLDYEFDFE